MKRILFLFLSLISVCSFGQQSQSDKIIRNAITNRTFNGLVKQGSIDQLRAMSPNPNDLSTTYFCTEVGKEGIWKVKVGSNAVDNTGTLLVCANGVRIERICDFTKPEFFGAIGNGIVDDTQAIQKCFNNGGNIQFNNSSIYAVSNFIEISVDGTTLDGNFARLIAKNDISKKMSWGGGHNHQIILISANNVDLSDLKINGNGFLAGGVASQGVSNLSLVRISSENSIESQGITLTALNNAKVSNCNLSKVLHGVQLWNCDNVTISSNNVDLVKMGGIWQANSSNIKYIENNVKNCGDVGIDIEGGQNILVSGNNIQNCKNGEFSIFRNAVDSSKPDLNILVVNNTIIRNQTYINTSGVQYSTMDIGGAIWINSFTLISQNNANINIKSNVIKCKNRFALYQNQPSSFSINTAFTFEDNQIETEGSPFFRIQGGYGLRIKGNTFTSNSQNDIYENEVKNISNCDISENDFIYKNKSSGYAISYFTDISGIIASRFFNNSVSGLGTQGLEMKHDPYVSGVSAILKGNSFTPISTPNGVPRYININGN